MSAKGILIRGPVIVAELKKLEAECREMEKTARRLFRQGRAGWRRFFPLFS